MYISYKYLSFNIDSQIKFGNQLKIVIQSHIDNIHTVYQWLELLLKEKNLPKKLSQTILLITQ